MSKPFYDRLRTELEARRQKADYRMLPLVSFNQGSIFYDGVRYIDLASNDYLCIARDHRVFKDFVSIMTDTTNSGSEYADFLLLSSVSTGSTGSRLLTGNQPSFLSCENLIASLYNESIISDSRKRSKSKKHKVVKKKHTNDYEELNDPNSIDHNMNVTAYSQLQGLESIHDAVIDLDMDAEADDCEAIASDINVAEKGLSCLYFNSGYDANLGVVSALFGDHDLLLVDKLAHASIIDGMRAGKAKFMRYMHNNVEHLESLLEKYHKHYDNVIIVTESLFSMDGDFALLNKIVVLKNKYHNVLLYVDEAHAFGIFGEGGLGLCKELGVLKHVDFLIGTLSKAIGSQGAFLICKQEVKDYLVNFMRPLIYSTALPPINVTFSMYVIGLLKSTAMESKREYLRRISGYLHANLQELDITPSNSHIQPLITGDSDSALKASQLFRHYGMLALPVRYPSVPQGQARLRLVLNSDLRIDDIDKITLVVKRYRKLFI